MVLTFLGHPVVTAMFKQLSPKNQLDPYCVSSPD